MSLKTDYKDAVPASGTARKYKMVDNGDGTVSFQDVTTYSQAGDKAQASVFNGIGTEVNKHEADKSNPHGVTAAQVGAAIGNGHLNDNADLNTVTQSGMYRFGTVINGPAGASYGQLLVIHGALDTITQIIGDYLTGNLYTRSGNPPNIGGAGAWGAWEPLSIGNQKSWVATAATNSDGWVTELTIPGFVMAEGCQVTYKIGVIPQAGTPEANRIRINGSLMYNLLDHYGSALNSNSFVAGIVITVVLSSTVTNTSWGPQGTAFIEGGSVNYANNASLANYPSHWIGLQDFGLRGNVISSSSPAGGQDGDTWDQV